ncbi:MAG: HAD-IB family phosphatase [Candidatus Omnitrophota bacterium]
MASTGILVSDFDGTITRFDFYDLVCREFPGVAGGFWQEYEAGKITHFEALRLIFAGIRAPEEQMAGIINRMEIDPALRTSIASLNSSGWQVVVASAGCGWYIQKLLAAQGVSLEVHTNPGAFSPDKGLEMRLPEVSPFFSPDIGVDKAAVVREALKSASRVAFAGDGRPDLAPALMVPPQRRFARNWLANKLSSMGEKFHPFERWSDIVPVLMTEKELL